MTGKISQLIFGILLLLAVSLITFGLVKKYRKPGSMTVLESQAMDMSSMAAPPGSFPVAAQPVKKGELAETVSYTGTAVPFNLQEVSPRVSGYLTGLLVYPGDRVEPGQLLATLRAEELNSQAAQAQAGYQGAESALNAVRAELKSADSRLLAAKADYQYWENEIKREENLYQEGAVSQEEYQRELSEYQKVKARLAEAEADLKAGRFKLKEAESLREKEQFARQTAEIYQDYTQLRSELRGVVSRRLKSPGSLVLPGEVVYTLSQLDPIRLQANVAEEDLAGIKVGSPVKIYREKTKKTFLAKVTAIFPALNPTSRTGIVEAVIENPRLEILGGEYLVMALTKSKKANALSVPSQAILELNGKPALWLVKEQKNQTKTLYTCPMHPEVISEKPENCPKCGMKLGLKQSPGQKTAHLVYVTPGITDGQETEIVEGIKEGDEVIYAGFQDLKEGDKVYPTQWGVSGPKELSPPHPPAQEAMPETMPGMESKEKMPETPHHH